MRRWRAAASWWRGTLIGLSWTRQSVARAGVLAAGIAFIAFFALFPVLVLGFTLVSWLISDDVQLQQRIVDQIDAGLGVRLLGVGPDDGLVPISDLVGLGSPTLTGTAGMVVMAISGFGWLNATREGIRAVAGLPRSSLSLRTVLRDLLVAIVLGAVVLCSAIGGTGLAAAATTVLGPDYGAATGIVVTVASAAALTVVDATVLWILIRLLAGVRAPWRDLAPGLLLGGVAFQVLKLSGGLLLHKVGGNPLLAGATAMALLLLWLHLAVRILLLTSSVCVTVAERRGNWSVPEQPG
jgi:membrane protein